MFFESRGSLIVAAILLIAGCYEAVSSREFAEAASREASTMGVITYISGGRAPSYEFKFVVNGHQRMARSGSCRTLLNGCAVGKPVRVYYDPAQIVATTLQEYGDRAWEMLIVGVFFILGGLLVTVLHFVFGRMEKDSDEDEDSDGPGESSSRDDIPLHVTPDA
jgi:hypothetical protein